MDDHVEPLAENASLHLYEVLVHIQMALVDVLLLFHRISFFLAGAGYHFSLPV